MDNIDIISGARTLLSAGGTLMGHCEGGRVSEDVLYDGVDVLGLMEIFEHVPVGYLCGFSATFARIFGKSLKSLNLFPRVGKGGQELLDNIVKAKPLEALLLDKVHNLPYAELAGFRFARHEFTSTPRGHISEDVTAVAKLVIDESEV